MYLQYLKYDFSQILTTITWREKKKKKKNRGGNGQPCNMKLDIYFVHTHIT